MKKFDTSNYKRKEYNQRRKIDYTVRDLSHMDKGNSDIRSGGCFFKFLLLSIIIAALGFAIFNFTKKIVATGDSVKIHRYNNGIEKIVKVNLKDSFQSYDNEYYRLSIAIESRKSGLISYENLANIKFIQKLIRSDLSLDSISMADYIEKTYSVLRKGTEINNLKGSKEIIIQRILLLLEAAGFNNEDFTGINYSHYYLYIKKDGKRNLDSIKSEILRIIKAYSMNRKIVLIADFTKGPQRIIPLSKIRDDSGSLVIDK